LQLSGKGEMVTEFWQETWSDHLEQTDR